MTFHNSRTRAELDALQPPAVPEDFRTRQRLLMLSEGPGDEEGS